MPKAANTATMVKVCRLCPNLRDLTILRRGNEAGKYSPTGFEDAGGLVFVLEACPGVTSFTYGTYLEVSRDKHMGFGDRARIDRISNPMFGTNSSCSSPPYRSTATPSDVGHYKSALHRQGQVFYVGRGYQHGVKQHAHLEAR